MVIKGHQEVTWCGWDSVLLWAIILQSRCNSVVTNANKGPLINEFSRALSYHTLSSFAMKTQQHLLQRVGGKISLIPDKVERIREKNNRNRFVNNKVMVRRRFMRSWHSACSVFWRPAVLIRLIRIRPTRTTKLLTSVCLSNAYYVVSCAIYSIML